MRKFFQYFKFFLRLNQMLYALSLSYHSNTEAVCLQVFRQAGPPQRIDCLASRWETALSVFPKDTATHYHIGDRSKVSQPFDYKLGIYVATEPRRRLNYFFDLTVMNYSLFDNIFDISSSIFVQ